jgi:FlaG/FlaF family flagellin (archaellin)
MNKIMKKLRATKKKLRAISPVLAILLMIVITVAASLVTYAWVMGYLSFTTAKAGRAMQVQSVAWDNDTQILTVYVQNVGEDFVTLQTDSSVYVDGYLKTDVDITGTTAQGVLEPGNTAPIYIQNVTMGLGQRVRVRVVDLSGTFTEIHTVPLGGTGGVIPFVEIPNVTQELENYSDDTTTGGFTGVQAGDLLVVIPNHRTGTFTTDGETCTAAGYTTVEVASFMTNTGDRRAVALLIRVADGTESGEVTCTWGGGALTYATIYKIYRGATTWTPGASDVDHGVGSSASSTVSISGLPTSTTANVLTIGALVTRNDPGSVTMTNLAFPYDAMDDDCHTFTEYSYGDAVTETVMTLPTDRQASGYLVQIACTDPI